MSARLKDLSIKKFKTQIKDAKGFIDLILELELRKQVIQHSHAITNQMFKSCDSNSRMPIHEECQSIKSVD